MYSNETLQKMRKRLLFLLLLGKVMMGGLLYSFSAFYLLQMLSNIAHCKWWYSMTKLSLNSWDILSETHTSDVIIDKKTWIMPTNTITILHFSLHSVHHSCRVQVLLHGRRHQRAPLQQREHRRLQSEAHQGPFLSSSFIYAIYCAGLALVGPAQHPQDQGDEQHSGGQLVAHRLRDRAGAWLQR